MNKPPKSKMIGESHVAIEDNGTWPAISQRNIEIMRSLTYSNSELSRSDRVMAASIINAYYELVNATQQRRNAVCKTLKLVETIRSCKKHQASKQTIVCPNCGGPTEHDREVPPNPHYCEKCNAK